MGFRSALTTFLWVPLILASAEHPFAQGTLPPPAPKGSMLLLHYRWQRDSLTLIRSERVPAAIKLSRSAPEKRNRGPAATGGDPRSVFSFELFDADGKRIRTRYLRDPGLRRVEYQEKGQHGLKSQEERVDSADILLRIPEADAKTIRFFRHSESPSSSPSDAASKGSAAVAAAQGPGDPPSKTMVAEFPLE
jgi:hypothetical protein